MTPFGRYVHIIIACHLWDIYENKKISNKRYHGTAICNMKIEKFWDIIMKVNRIDLQWPWLYRGYLVTPFGSQVHIIIACHVWDIYENKIFSNKRYHGTAICNIKIEKLWDIIMRVDHIKL